MLRRVWRRAGRTGRCRLLFGTQTHRHISKGINRGQRREGTLWLDPSGAVVWIEGLRERRVNAGTARRVQFFGPRRAGLVIAALIGSGSVHEKSSRVAKGIFAHLTWTTWARLPLIDPAVGDFLLKFLPAECERHRTRTIALECRATMCTCCSSSPRHSTFHG